MIKLKLRQVKNYQKKCKLKKKELLLCTVVLFTHLTHVTARGGYLTPLQFGRLSKESKIQFVPVLI